MLNSSSRNLGWAPTSFDRFIISFKHTGLRSLLIIVTEDPSLFLFLSSFVHPYSLSVGLSELQFPAFLFCLDVHLLFLLKKLQQVLTSCLLLPLLLCLLPNHHLPLLQMLLHTLVPLQGSRIHQKTSMQEVLRVKFLYCNLRLGQNRLLSKEEVISLVHLHLILFLKFLKLSLNNV